MILDNLQSDMDNIDGMIHDLTSRVRSNLTKGSMEQDPLVIAGLYAEIMVNLAKTKKILTELENNGHI